MRVKGCFSTKMHSVTYATQMDVKYATTEFPLTHPWVGGFCLCSDSCRDSKQLTAAPFFLRRRVSMNEYIFAGS